MSDSNYTITDLPHYGYSKATRRWEEVTLPLSGFGEWLRNYHTVEIAIADMLDNPYVLNATLYPELTHWPTGLVEWLVSLGNKALPHLNTGVPTLDRVVATVQPLFYNVVDVTLCPPDTHPTQDFSIDDADDMVLGYTDDDLTTATDSCLFSVGGLWVPFKHETYGVRLLGAGNIIRRSGLEGGTIVNFGEIGNLKIHPMDTLQVSRVDTELTHRTTLTIQTPANLYGKSLLLFIAGKMHIIPSSAIISENVFSISGANWEIAEHILNTHNRLDWSYLGLDDPDSGISVSRLLNDNTFIDYINHPLSFLAVVDNPYLQYDYGVVDMCRRTGVYISEGVTAPGLLVSHTHEVIDHWPTFTGECWGLYTRYVDAPNYAMFNGKYRKQSTVKSTLHHLKPYTPPNLRMLNISAKT